MWEKESFMGRRIAEWTSKYTFWWDPSQVNEEKDRYAYSSSDKYITNFISIVKEGASEEEEGTLHGDNKTIPGSDEERIFVKTVEGSLDIERNLDLCGDSTILW